MKKWIITIAAIIWALMMLITYSAMTRTNFDGWQIVGAMTGAGLIIVTVIIITIAIAFAIICLLRMLYRAAFKK